MMICHEYTSRSGQAGGGSFRGTKTISQRKNLPIECAHRGWLRDVMSCDVIFVCCHVM